MTELAEKLLEQEVIFKEDLEAIFGKRQWEKEEQVPIIEKPISEQIEAKEGGEDNGEDSTPITELNPDQNIVSVENDSEETDSKEV